MYDGITIIEKTSLVGIISLAVSDFLFCLATICETYIVEHRLIHTSFDGSVFFTMYGAYIQNCLIKISTAIVTLMAIFRYFILFYPFKTNEHKSKLFRVKITSIILAFLFWITIHIPLLFVFELDQVHCSETRKYILLRVGYYMKHDTFRNTCTYLWAILGFIIPFIILGFSNVSIIYLLYKRKRKPKERPIEPKKRSNEWQTTVTLICIVVFCVILILPSEAVHFYLYTIEKDPLNNDWVRTWRHVITITNLLQAVNMAFNFALYCCVNRNFRKTLPVLYCIVNTQLSHAFQKLKSLCLGRSVENNSFIEFELEERESSAKVMLS